MEEDRLLSNKWSSHSTNKQASNNHKPQTGRTWPVPRVVTVNYLKYLVSNKKCGGMKRNRKLWLIYQGGKQTTETACDTDLMLGLTKKDVKVAIINMFTAQKEVWLEKHRKTWRQCHIMEIISIKNNQMPSVLDSMARFIFIHINRSFINKICINNAWYPWNVSYWI